MLGTLFLLSANSIFNSFFTASIFLHQWQQNHEMLCSCFCSVGIEINVCCCYYTCLFLCDSSPLWTGIKLTLHISVYIFTRLSVVKTYNKCSLWPYWLGFWEEDGNESLLIITTFNYKIMKRAFGITSRQEIILVVSNCNYSNCVKHASRFMDVSPKSWI